MQERSTVGTALPQLEAASAPPNPTSILAKTAPLALGAAILAGIAAVDARIEAAGSQ